MSQPTIARHYTRLLSLWPKDLLRPNAPFTRTIERRATPHGVKPITPPPEDATRLGKQTPVPQLNSQAELRQINALYSLLENRYSKKNPISEGVLKPASNPEHYDRLMEEIERAPKKSWLQAKMDEWKMKIRWQ